MSINFHPQTNRNKCSRLKALLVPQYKNMHYKNGREAKEGDQVIGKFGWPEKARVGTIHSLNAGAVSCNGTVGSIIPGGIIQSSATVGELYHAEDALALCESTKPEEWSHTAPPVDNAHVEEGCEKFSAPVATPVARASSSSGPVGILGN